MSEDNKNADNTPPPPPPPEAPEPQNLIESVDPDIKTESN